MFQCRLRQAQRLDKSSVCRLLGTNWGTVGAIIECIVEERLSPNIRRAYGFRNQKSLMAMIPLFCGGMEFTPPMPAAA